MKRLGWIAVVVMLLGSAAVSSARAGAQSEVKKTSPTTSSRSKKKQTREPGKTSAKQTSTSSHGKAAKHSTSGAHPTSHSGSKQGSRVSGSRSKAGHGHGAASVDHLPQPTAESRRLNSAFIASAQLRPMAQQLVTVRSAAAYAGVQAYAASHPGEAAASAELAIGHAYMLDRRYADAENAFRQASIHGVALDDYANYLEAQAAIGGNRPQDAIPLLTHFSDRHPISVFDGSAPILLATAYLAGNDANGALRVLQPLLGTPAANKVDFRLTLAKAYQTSGERSKVLQPLSRDLSGRSAESRSCGCEVAIAADEYATVCSGT